MHALIEHIDQRLQGRQTNPRVTLGQGVDAQEHHRADHLGRQRRAHATRVADDESLLQELGVFGPDDLISIRAEPGGDAVNGLAAMGHLAHITRRLVNLGVGRLCDLYFFAIHDDRFDRLKREEGMSDLHDSYFT